MKTSPNFHTVAASLMTAKAEIAQLPLVKDAQGDRARYIKLGTVLTVVEPVLHRHGWMIVQGCGENITHTTLLAITIETTLLHISGEWMQSAVVVPLVGAKKKKEDGGGTHAPDAQSGGGAQTYGRRYGLFAILSLAIAEDDDGASASLKRRKKVAEYSENHPAPKITPSGPWTEPGIMPWGTKRGTPMAEIADAELRAAMADARRKSATDEAAVIEYELKERATKPAATVG